MTDSTLAQAGPVAVIGSGGMLGTAWRELLDQQNISHARLDLPHFDLLNEITWPAHLPERGGTVINCAAYTDVDGAEADEAAATELNGHAVGKLAQWCAQRDTLLVHYSTDYVFSGSADQPYPVDAPTGPIGAYGRSKLIGEQQLAESGCRHLLIRTSWLYAPWGKNFVITMHNLTRDRDELKVVHDQRGRPTSAQHLAAATLGLIEADQAGTFHLTDGGQCTWYELTRHIAEANGATCDIQPCSTDEFPRPAPRPTYSVLDLGRAESVLGPIDPWQGRVSQVIGHL